MNLENNPPSPSLEQEHAFLTALLSNVPDAIYFKDLQSRFLCVSQAMADKVGASGPESMVGKTDFDFFTKEHAQEAFDDEQKIVNTSKPVINIEEKETLPNGHVTWASTSKMPLHGSDGRVIGTFGISRDITSRKEAEVDLKKAQKELLEASRLAGMAEISSGILHNIGNGLNSVNTTIVLAGETLARSRIGNLGKAAKLIQEHSGDLGSFFTTDERGKQLPGYLLQLAELLEGERNALRKEVDQLRQYVEHIMEIVSMQQNYSRVSGICELASPAELVEEALNISEISLHRHGVEVKRDFAPTPEFQVTRHKVLQILVNFIRNAKYSLDETGRTNGKNLTISVRATENETVRISVSDDGVGIATENRDKIFNFGFTTRSDGHGFGLHSSANAAKELGGEIIVESDGPGKGAVFTLEVPIKAAKQAHAA
jgi:PAS domain S-box-containing protein